jgi:energy-coupling factor transport system permease protein
MPPHEQDARTPGSDEKPIEPGGGRTALLRGLAPVHVATIAVGILLGTAVRAVGLPGTWELFGTSGDVLTTPVALLIALGTISVTGAVTARSPWRVVDLVVAAVLGVAGGLFLWGIATSWNALTTPLNFYPPASASLAGLWLVPGVLGGLVLRRPGAALFCELMAAVLEAILGNQWGFSTVYYGVVEGLGAEFVLALLLYRGFGLLPAMLSGAGSGAGLALLDLTIWYPTFSASYRTAYIGLAILSGAVIAGVGSWALTRALARVGVLAPLASGAAAERV